MNGCPFPKIGIMQGRLSKPEKGRIQSFPRQTWRQEFRAAAKIGFDSIEFVFDESEPEDHPIFTQNGLAAIRTCCRETGVACVSVCADYFMFHPLHKGAAAERDRSYNVLHRLIDRCGKLGVTDVILPCVDQSTLSTAAQKQILTSYLAALHPFLLQNNVNLALESDMPPHEFRAFLTDVNLERIKVNYDTGNSASLGYNVIEELEAYGRFISAIHIKDRLFKGTTVPLGTGNTPFAVFFSELVKTSYGGGFIIQGARGNDEAEVAKEQLEFVQKLIQKYYVNLE